MPLHLKKCSNIKITNFSGQSPNTYVKENHILSRERITVMITVAFTEKKNSKHEICLQRKRNSYQTESYTKCYSPMDPKRILPVTAYARICEESCPRCPLHAVLPIEKDLFLGRLFCSLRSVYQ